MVISTLALAALYRPLRRPIQGFFDRRYYRNRFDAARTLAEFAVRARDVVESVRIEGELLRVVQETMQSRDPSPWVRGAR